MTVERVCGSGAWLPRLAHTWALQATAPASARSRSGCRSHPALASQSQARFSRSAPRCGPLGRGLGGGRGENLGRGFWAFSCDWRGERQASRSDFLM